VAQRKARAILSELSQVEEHTRRALRGRCHLNQEEEESNPTRSVSFLSAFQSRNTARTTTVLSIDWRDFKLAQRDLHIHTTLTGELVRCAGMRVQPARDACCSARSMSACDKGSR
jgi:hypothetical protein